MALDNAPNRRVVYSAITVDDAVAEANDAIQLWDAISSGGINAAKVIERLSNDLKLALDRTSKLTVGFVISKAVPHAPVANASS